MKVLLLPATEGYGHVSRTLAICRALDRRGIGYGILTDARRAEFLVANGVAPSAIDASFNGISYTYSRRDGNYNLNLPLTIGKFVCYAPLYLYDYLRVIVRHIRKKRYSVLVNDFCPYMARMPGVRVLNIGHYTHPRSRHDLVRLLTHSFSLCYEGLLEPFINIPTFLSDRFAMEIRRSIIDGRRIHPPVVAELTRSPARIRRDLELARGDRLVVDGRGDVPVRTYEDLGREYPDVHFLVRSANPGSGNVHTARFIPAMVNFVAAADIFVTNPGFASISEGAVYGTPMLFNHPGNHFEQFKNLRCAEAEGYGRRIRDLEQDLLSALSERREGHGSLPNGLPALVDRIARLDRQARYCDRGETNALRRASI